MKATMKATMMMRPGPIMAIALTLSGVQFSRAAPDVPPELAAALRSSHTIYAPAPCTSELTPPDLRQWSACEREWLVR